MGKSTIVRWSDPKVILVATNLIEGQTLILHAIYQASLSRASVLLVHVIRPSDLKTDAPNGVPAFVPIPAEREIKTELDETTKEFQSAGILCEPIVLTGNPAEQISQLVKLRTVDRVIVATRYASGVARLLKPSVAEELIAILDVPVCVVGRRAHLPPACGKPFGRILLAMSLHSRSPLLARFASTLAELNQSQLTVLHVLEAQGLFEQERELARLSAHRKLCSLISNETSHRHPPTLVVREGDPASIILEETRSLPQDVLILGSPNPLMVSRFLTNSVVHRVVVESQCPVITIGGGSVTSAEERRESAVAELMSNHS